jgi:D-alanyl-D-alanine endopeptidase (penicillin-binding protein 7)
MNRGTWQKFLFLGVMIVIALLSGGGTRWFAPPRASFSPESVSLPPLAADTSISGAYVLSGAETSESHRTAVGVGETGDALLTSGILRNKIFYPVSPEAPPALQAQAALVADLQTGETYFDLNADKRWPMASLTKLMTAAYAMRNIDMNAEIALLPRDFPPDVGDTSPSLKPGDVYRLKDLLQALLISSSNAAAETIANFYGRDNFISGLNQMAKDWGMISTYFDDPSGLSVANQASARDLRLMALKIYETYPGILKTTRQRNAAVTEVKSGRREVFENTNLFAGQKWFLGGKTGYTDEAGGNLLTLISEKGRPVVVVVLGAGDRFGETEKLINWFRENYRLNS